MPTKNELLAAIRSAALKQAQSQQPQGPETIINPFVNQETGEAQEAPGYLNEADQIALQFANTPNNQATQLGGGLSVQQGPAYDPRPFNANPTEQRQAVQALQQFLLPTPTEPQETENAFRSAVEMDTAMRPHDKKRAYQAAGAWASLTKTASDPRTTDNQVRGLQQQFRQQYPEFAEQFQIKRMPAETIAKMDAQVQLEQERDVYEAAAKETGLNIPRSNYKGTDKNGKPIEHFPTKDLITLKNNQTKNENDRLKAVANLSDMAIDAAAEGTPQAGMRLGAELGIFQEKFGALPGKAPFGENASIDVGSMLKYITGKGENTPVPTTPVQDPATQSAPLPGSPAGIADIRVGGQILPRIQSAAKPATPKPVSKEPSLERHGHALVGGGTSGPVRSEAIFNFNGKRYQVPDAINTILSNDPSAAPALLNEKYEIEIPKEKPKPTPKPVAPPPKSTPQQLARLKGEVIIQHNGQSVQVPEFVAKAIEQDPTLADALIKRYGGK